MFENDIVIFSASNFIEEQPSDANGRRLVQKTDSGATSDGRTTTVRSYNQRRTYLLLIVCDSIGNGLISANSDPDVPYPSMYMCTGLFGGIQQCLAGNRMRQIQAARHARHQHADRDLARLLFTLRITQPQPRCVRAGRLQNVEHAQGLRLGNAPRHHALTAHPVAKDQG